MRALALLALLALPIVGFSQSLGEAARQEAERRKKAQGEGPGVAVIDEEALTKASAARQDDAAGKAPLASESSPTPQADGRGDAHIGRNTGAAPTETNDLERERAQRARDEKMWRERVASASARVEKARARYDAVKDMSLPPGQAFVDRGGRVVVRSPEHLQRMVADAKAELDAAEKTLDDVLDSARRAGIPPGWLR